MAVDLSGPNWFQCLSEVSHYYGEIEDMEDDVLEANSYRVEVKTPPTDPNYNDREWRFYRRLVRQEMHRRGLKTPSKEPDTPCY